MAVSYSGDVNYAPSATSISITIGPMAFTVTPATSNVTVTQAGSATTVLNVTSFAGYKGYVGLSCSGLPANTTCGFSSNGFVLQADNLIRRRCMTLPARS